ncbi:phage tail protein [Pseudomonas aeruginosa]|nr:phage tail protein [Pseudomonas aeruginosa]HBN7642433.1 phage tail protein [Pseudomonas aeruginosa]HBN7783247.1 phage tail protein [Pseudomonas aeruginosa]HBN7804118.1 phage tail protein [Pseudomonas aeruginosa]HBN7838169.1 phage tail protein [Pseudomonas aeruginosa]
MALPITITDAGRAEIINAQNTGTGPVTITEIGFGTGQYTPTKTRTALQAQVKRVSSIAGQAVAADTIHVMALDESSAAYNVGEFGLFSDKGTLIAVYSQPEASGWIIQKAGASTLLLATDIILESLNATSITFGDISFINPPATTTIQGVVELATPEETQAGTDGARAVTPAGLKSLTGNTSRAGLLQLNNTLTSTSTAMALTAAQGKKLQDEKQPLDETLTALAALVTAANKLIYATGIDTFATTDLTAFARTLLDDQNAAAALATLGAAPLDSPVFTGNPQVPTQSAADSDTSAASTAFVRAAMALFGLGSDIGPLLGSADLNTVLTSGFYGQNANASATLALNYPVTQAGTLVVLKASTSIATQIYRVYSTGETYTRGYYSGTWSGWRKQFDTGNFDPSLKANLDSPTFTGNPTAPTAASTDSDTSIATTAFVREAMALFGIGAAIPPVTGALNDIAVTGLYSFENTSTNRPFDYGLVWHLSRGVSDAIQIATRRTSSHRMSFRYKQGGTWSAWQELFHSGNVSSFAQTLLDDQDAATARATLGAAAVATTLAGYGINDALSFKVSPSIEDSSVSWNSLTAGGLHPKLILGSNPGGPGTSLYFYCRTYVRIPIDGSGSGALQQFAEPYGSPTSSGQMYWRGLNGTTWTPWTKVVGSDDHADQVSAEAGTSTSHWMSPLRVFQAIAKKVAQASESVLGIAKIATQAQTVAGTDDATIVTPKKIRYGFAMSFSASSGYLLLPTWLGSALFQYGRVTLAADTETTFTWPLAWPEACYALAGGVLSASAREQDGVAAQFRLLTQSNVVINRQDINATVATSRDIFVFGLGK